MESPIIHEPGDEFLRPTNKPWRCLNCGQKLFTVSAILSHKERCKSPQQKVEEKKVVAKWKSPATGKEWNIER